MKIVGWIIAIPVVLLVLIGLSRGFFCGPNSKDVEVMQPMTKKISDYIVQNGVPESLKDIPGLPYELECEKAKEEYFIYDSLGSSIKAKKEEAISMTIHEHCLFYVNNRSYHLNTIVEFYFKKYGSSKKAYEDIRIENIKSNTWGIVDFTTDWNNKTTLRNGIDFGSSKTDGICHTMKQ